ncbi:MAG TPA: deiodinase-related protein, partial [Candidatus Angelobacter sp.]|nr:deiodinase-related protein [Candidatus Angelobacter sp.]
ERAYTGWPDRIYLIDPLGKIAYKSKAGPFGFKPDELAAALSRIPLAQ